MGTSAQMTRFSERRRCPCCRRGNAMSTVVGPYGRSLACRWDDCRYGHAGGHDGRTPAFHARPASVDDRLRVAADAPRVGGGRQGSFPTARTRARNMRDAR